MSGVVSESIDPNVPNGLFYLVDIENISHFSPEDFPRMGEPEHWIVRGNRGKYYKIRIGDKWTDL